MRYLGILMVAAAAAAAETPPSAAVVRGVLLERDPQPKAGQFSVRLPDNQVLRYQFDWKTYVLRDENQLIDIPRISPGEKVEVVSDSIPGFVLRYARTVHVLPDVAPRPPSLARARRGMADRLAEERALPLGALTYAGVVYRITGERLILHTRDGREQSMLLRKDTRYLQNGEIVDPESLRQNMRVFVRAGKDLWDQVEAYQVIWGKILDPND
jgi:hypothetical protein